MYNCAMSRGNRRLWVGSILFLVSLLLLGWGSWPLGRQSRTVQALALASENTQAGGVSSAGWITLDAPRRARLGDIQVFRLNVRMQAEEAPSAAQTAAENPPPAEPVASVQFQTSQNLIVEARLEMPGASLAPAGDMLEPVTAGKIAAFTWQVRPERAGELEGMLWLHLRKVPRDGGAEARQILATQRLALPVSDLLGVGGAGARLLGGVGLLAGVTVLLSHKLVRPVRKPGNSIDTAA